MTRSPNLSSTQGQGRAPKRERRSTLSNSFSEAMSYPGDSHREQGGADGGLGLTGQTASSSTTDLVDVSTDKDNDGEEGDETMRMDMDGEDDMAMAMSDEEDEVDDRRRVNGYGRGNPTGAMLQQQQQQHQQQQHSYQPNHHHPNHNLNHQVPPPAPPSNGSHKKPGFSPLDLLVGVAEQARRVTGTGNHAKSQSQTHVVDQPGGHHHHLANNDVHAHYTGVNGNGNGMGNGGEKSKTGGNRGSWAHIEVGEGR